MSEPVRHGGCFRCGSLADRILVSTSDTRVLAQIPKAAKLPAVALCASCRKDLGGRDG